MGGKVTPKMLEILRRGKAYHYEYTTCRALALRGLIHFGKTQWGYAITLTEAGKAVCVCGKSNGSRPDHEAECRAAYLAKN